jgi:hypothetical protein
MKVIKWLALSVFALFAAAQLVPYGGPHDNPRTVAEPPWSSAADRALAQRACFDCHSNETRWPWYSYVAPASWLVAYDVNEGRERLNFSDWVEGTHDADEASEEVLEGEMPPRIYTVLHPEAVLTPAERRELAAALSFGPRPLDVD